MRKWLLSSVWIWTCPALAVEYNGRVFGGFYQSKEEFAEPVNESITNDQLRFLGRAYFEANDIGSLRNQFVFDLRDKYDLFGLADRDQLLLIESNEPQLRQLAFKYPNQRGSFNWSLGRFPIPGAGVLANDGADVGFKLTDELRLGGFGGLIPDHHAGGSSLGVNTDDLHAGGYLTLRDLGRDPTEHTYSSNALILRRSPPGRPMNEKSTRPETPEAPAPVELDEDDVEDVNYIHFFSNSVFQRNSGARFTELLDFYFFPEVHIRNGFASYTHPITKNFQGTASFLTYDLLEYEKFREFRDALTASAYTEGTLRGDFQTSARTSFRLQAKYGTRSEDSLSRTEVLAQTYLQRLPVPKSAMRLTLGSRKNFQSDDVFARLRLEYYQKALESSLSQEFVRENRSNDKTLNVSATDLEIGYYFANKVLTSAIFEYVTDSEVTIASFLLTVGYRFSSKQLTPLPDELPGGGALQ